MKVINLAIIFSIFLYAQDYFAKIEPLNKYNIKAQTSGRISYVNKNLEGTIVINNTIVKIDNTIDKIELNQLKIKLLTLEQIIQLEKNTLKKFQSIRTKSQLDKDNQKIKILNLQGQQSDLIYKKAFLKDKIKDKIYKEKNRYIISINTNLGDFVNPGTLLYTTADLTKGKIEIFLSLDQIKKYLNKSIYINNKLTNYKINKFYKITDERHISLYKCEIITDPQELFSRLVKINFK